jgi:hypothetical protein
MILQPDYPENPFSLIISTKNKKMAKLLQGNGADAAKVDKILRKFHDWKMVFREIDSNANNPEWLEVKAWRGIVRKQYEKAIRSLEILMKDDSIPVKTRETIIEKDIDALKKRKDFLTSDFMTRATIKPTPESLHQMIVFQSYALFEYIRKYKGNKPDKDIYDFLAELLRNLYKNTLLASAFVNINGVTLKKNYIDNAYKLRGKYNELEKYFLSLSF